MQLRQLRDHAGYKIDQVADALECSPSKVSRIENGRVAATPDDVRIMLELYGITGKRQAALVEAAVEAQAKGWWRSYRHRPRDVEPLIDLESTATSIQIFAALIVPGLFQTPEYARGIIQAVHPELSLKDIDRHVELRMSRQLHLLKHDPPNIWLILDEATLRRPVRGPEVMEEQLLRLKEMAAMPAITIQVLPFSAGEHMGMSGSFSIYALEDLSHPGVVFLENAVEDDYIYDRGKIQQYHHTFEHLRAMALNPRESLAFFVA